MDPVITEIKIFDNRIEDDVKSLQTHTGFYDESVQDICVVCDFSLLIVGGRTMANYSEKQEIWYGVDVNIAIASAVTSGARTVIIVL
jgi:hypothetical protein